MSDIQQITNQWFTLWESGDYMQLPLADDFEHHSPYGVIKGKEAYLKLVDDNKEKFLGNNRFDILDELYEANRACVRYKRQSSGNTMHVTEWFHVRNQLIEKIYSFYSLEEDSQTTQDESDSLQQQYNKQK